jgi:CheY-like chemotaxis protein
MIPRQAQKGGSLMNHSPQTAKLSSAPRRQRILVVDDHDVGRRSLCRLLEFMGYEVTSVKDGQEALETMRTSTSPDYVLTDVRLPDLDGREVVQAARRLIPRPWIAFITGWDLADEESQSLGIDWVFLKPLNISDIVAKLREVTTQDAIFDRGIGNLGEEGCSSP